MIFTTTSSLPADQDYKVVSLLEANSAQGANFARDWFAGLRDTFGGRSRSYEPSLRALAEDVTGKLEQQAVDKEADAVIGFQTQLTVAGDSKMFVMQAFGTAIKFKQ